MRAKFINEYLELPGKSEEEIINDLKKLPKSKLNLNLFGACYAENIYKVKMLLKAGADPNYINEYGQSLLALAAADACEEIIKELLDNGADVNIQNEHGWTALMWASRHGFNRIVYLLLKHGANPFIKNSAGNNAIYFATINKFTNIVYKLKRIKPL